MVEGLLRDRCGAGHVLVRRVGAGTDEPDLELGWPVVLLDGLLELGERGREIGCEWTVDVGLKFIEVLYRFLISAYTRKQGLKRTMLTTWSYSAPSSGFKLCWKRLA